MKRKSAKKIFSQVKLLVLDVDGVLTKGEIIYDNEGRELKMFNVKDGLGIFLLHLSGIPTLLLSARDSHILRKRGKDMRVCEVIGGTLPKNKMLPGILKKYKVSKKEICFVGDDLIDISIMKEVGAPVAVRDAHSEVKKHASYVTSGKGGEGAVREVAESILKARGLWKPLLQKFDSIVKK